MNSTTDNRKQSKSLVGVVTSSARDKTITVSVTVKVPHPLYKKFIKRATKYHAHDEKNQANKGDTVRILEGRPVSKTKRWRLAEVIKKGSEL